MEEPNTSVLQARLDRVEADIKKIDEMEKEINSLKVEIARLSERLAIYQLLQAGFATIAAVVASTIAKVLP